ncbi:hypothetical protein [Nonomuraea jabiensis]|uniref:hypothetical protein n=1 Tax=Nonomuraea jabiensis TaxID=882448 RepID=UPI003D7426EA
MSRCASIQFWAVGRRNAAHEHVPEVEARIDQPLRLQTVPRGEHLAGDWHGVPLVVVLAVGGGRPARSRAGGRAYRRRWGGR